MTNGEFIEALVPGAKEQMVRLGVLASLTMAQAILESGWGKSDLATKANNLFGIKGTGPAGSMPFPTQEWNGTEMEPVKADFRKYNSWEESIADHASLFQKLTRYQNLLGITDYRRACVLVQKDGYATDPNYSNKLIQIIETYGLAEYDKQTIIEKSIPEWAIEPRNNLIQLGITDGERPNDYATRLEAWALAFRILQEGDKRRLLFETEIRDGLPDQVSEAVKAYAPDISEDVPEWATGAAADLKGMNVTDGTRPNHPATRAELWVMLERVFEIKKADDAQFIKALEQLSKDMLERTNALDERETELRQRVEDIETQLEQKGFISKMVALVLKPFKRGGNT